MDAAREAKWQEFEDETPGVILDGCSGVMSDAFDAGWAAGVQWAREQVRAQGAMLEIVPSRNVPEGEIWFVRPIPAAKNNAREIVHRIVNIDAGASDERDPAGERGGDAHVRGPDAAPLTRQGPGQ